MFEQLILDKTDSGYGKENLEIEHKGLTRNVCFCVSPSLKEAFRQYASKHPEVQFKTLRELFLAFYYETYNVTPIRVIKSRFGVFVAIEDLMEYILGNKPNAINRQGFDLRRKIYKDLAKSKPQHSGRQVISLEPFDEFIPVHYLAGLIDIPRELYKVLDNPNQMTESVKVRVLEIPKTFLRELNK